MKLGIMQGRLINKGGFFPQQFPNGELWKKEFYISKEYNISCIEWMFNASDYTVNPLWTEYGRKEIISIMEETRVGIASICANFFMEKTLEKNIEILQQLTVYAKEIGCKRIVLPLFGESENIDEETLVTIINSAAKNMDIAIETNLTANKQKQLCKRIGNSRVGICYDLGNACGKGYNNEEDIEILKEYLQEVHIKDKSEQEQSVMLGKGKVNFTSVLYKLKEVGFSSEFILESYFGENAYLDTLRNYQYTVNQLIKKKWKVLVVGMGSAGQRHMRNLQSILGDSIEFIAYREQGHDVVYNDNLQIEENICLYDRYRLKEVESFESGLIEKPDIVIISNPNSMHMKYALKAAEYCCNMFVEKPLSSNMKGVVELERRIREKNLVCYVGYQMRLHPCITKTKEYIEKSKIGNIIHVSTEVGELLTAMHKYQDYHTMNESQKKTGGGVVTCQIHELDYLYYLFGLPTSILSIGGKKGDWDIDVEDCATSIMVYERADNRFAITIQQDYFQFPPSRKCKIIGTKGRIEIDLLKNSFLFHDENGNSEEELFEQFQRNDMFIEETLRLLNSLQNRKQTFVNINEASGSLRIALAIKKSMTENREVRLN